jgi:S1-C subfamily serine protease
MLSKFHQKLIELRENLIANISAMSTLKKSLLVALIVIDVVAIGAIAGIQLLRVPDTSALVTSKTASLHAQAVFMIKPYTENRQLIHTGGTGFLVKTQNGNTVILTNRHICRMDPSKSYVLLEQGLSVYAARILVISSLTDLCIIQAPPEIVASRIAYKLSAEDPTPGEHVTVYGHPYLRPLTRSAGRYVNTSREPLDMESEALAFDPKKVVRIGSIDFMVFPGNSGSPLLNDDDEVIGIIFAYDVTRAGLFIPLQDIKDLFERGE